MDIATAQSNLDKLPLEIAKLAEKAQEAWLKLSQDEHNIEVAKAIKTLIIKTENPKATVMEIEATITADEKIEPLVAQLILTEGAYKSAVIKLDNAIRTLDAVKKSCGLLEIIIKAGG